MKKILRTTLTIITGLVIYTNINAKAAQGGSTEERITKLEQTFDKIMRMLNTQAQRLQPIAQKLGAPDAPLKQAPSEAVTQTGSMSERLTKLEQTFNNSIVPMIKEQAELLNKLATKTMINDVESEKGKDVAAGTKEAMAME